MDADTRDFILEQFQRTNEKQEDVRKELSAKIDESIAANSATAITVAQEKVERKNLATRVRSLEKHRSWMVFSMITTLAAGVWMWLTGGK
jgi:cell division septum initiation protein DivIVA